MHYDGNDFIFPIIVGSDRKASAAACRLLLGNRFKPHLFSDRFYFWQRLFFFCHKVEPLEDEWLTCSLAAFASELEEYYTPMILLCNDSSRKLVERCREVLDSRFVYAEISVFFCGEEYGDDNE